MFNPAQITLAQMEDTAYQLGREDASRGFERYMLSSSIINPVPQSVIFSYRTGFRDWHAEQALREQQQKSLNNIERILSHGT